MTILDRLFGLGGKVALVTGAGSGIGQAIALALAEAGASMVLVGRRREALEETAAAVDAKGARAVALPCDLSKREELVRCAADAGQAFGSPDILISAAGVNLRRPIEAVQPDDWDATLRINLDAPFFLAQRLAPAMIERRWGRIINIASLQSLRALPESSAYGASKGAVMQLTRAQAQAWSRHGINVNAIAPGFFPTDLTAPVFADPERARDMAARTFIGRNGVLADLAGAAIFLASAASDYVTGQTLFVDGGFSAG
jgi:NAD(P)-dependent dehydrogenase (short-subunit alcohol dehydrogenase family)